MTDATQDSSRMNSSSPRRGRRLLLGGIVVFLAIVATTVSLRPRDDKSPAGILVDDPLPQADEIETTHVWLYGPIPERFSAEFNVPVQHQARLRSTLAPTRIDRDPPRCVGKGFMRIKTHRGEELGVSLFSTDYEIDNKYYHYPSGNYGAVGEAIDAAREDAAREKP